MEYNPLHDADNVMPSSFHDVADV
ncbi:hypothetical protein Tco_1113468, partial [Tanacetum coccineum]